MDKTLGTAKDVSQTPRPAKPATVAPPGRPQRNKHLTPRRGNVLCKEPSWEKSPCAIPGDCKLAEPKRNPNATVLDTGFPYVDFIQRNEDAKLGEHGGLDVQEPKWRKPTNNRIDHRKARRRSAAATQNMKTGGFQTFGLDLAMDKAEVYYQRKLKENPSNVEILRHYGCWLHANERLVEAERMFKKALLIEKRDIDVICAYAALLWDTGKHSRAEDMYRMALTFEPQHLPSLLNYGLALFSKGDYVASLQRFRKAGEVDPQNEQALLGVAVTLEKIGRTLNEEIDALYHEILSINPSSFDALYSYAMFLKNKEGRLYEAQEYYERALALRPHDVSVLCSYGVLLTEAAAQDPAAFTRAQMCFQQALIIQPRNPDALYSYAVMLSAWHRADATAALQTQPPTAESSQPGEPAMVHERAAVVVPSAAPSAEGLQESPWSRAVGGYLAEDSPAPSSRGKATADGVRVDSAASKQSAASAARPASSSTIATPSLPPPSAPGDAEQHSPSPHLPQLPPHPPAAPHAAPSAQAQATPRGARGITPWQGTPHHPWPPSTSRPSSAVLPSLSRGSKRPVTPRHPSVPESASNPGTPRRVGSHPPTERRGSLGFGTGRPGVVESEVLFKKALEVLGAQADALCAYAIFVHKVRAAAAASAAARAAALQEAEKLYRRALRLDPAHALARQGQEELRSEVTLAAAPSKHRKPPRTQRGEEADKSEESDADGRG